MMFREKVKGNLLVKVIEVQNKKEISTMRHLTNNAGTDRSITSAQTTVEKYSHPKQSGLTIFSLTKTKSLNLCRMSSS